MLLILSFFLMLSDPAIAWLTDTTHDFGDLEVKRTYYHTFEFANVSTQAVQIDNIRPSCGCTIPNWTREWIPPDSTATIRVEFRPNTVGYTRKQIKVFFSSQRKAEKLYLQAYVSR
jgi:hypothetical protein